MLQPVQKEIRAVVDLLEQDWESAEALAEAVIKAVDQARDTREMWVAVMEFGRTSYSYLAIGPYPGRKSATKAVNSFPGATEATRIAVVPLKNAAGVSSLLKEVG